MSRDLTLQNLGVAVSGRAGSDWVPLSRNGGLINIDEDVLVRLHVTRPSPTSIDEEIIAIGSQIKVVGRFGEEVPEASITLVVTDHTTLKVCVQRITDFIFALHHFPLIPKASK